MSAQARTCPLFPSSLGHRRALTSHPNKHPYTLLNPKATKVQVLPPWLDLVPARVTRPRRGFFFFFFFLYPSLFSLLVRWHETRQTNNLGSNLSLQKRNLQTPATFSGRSFFFSPSAFRAKLLFDVCWYFSFKRVEIVGRRVTQTETRRFHVSSYQDVGNFRSYLELEMFFFDCRGD